MGSADLATVTQHLRRIYWWLLVGKTLPEHQFGSMFADSGHGGNLAAHLPDHVCGFAFEAATRWLRLAWVRGFAGARVVGRRLSVAIFEGAEGFYRAGLREGDITHRSRLL